MALSAAERAHSVIASSEDSIRCIFVHTSAVQCHSESSSHKSNAVLVFLYDSRQLKATNYLTIDHLMCDMVRVRLVLGS